MKFTEVILVLALTAMIAAGVEIYNRMILVNAFGQPLRTDFNVTIPIYNDGGKVDGYSVVTPIDDES